MAVNVPLLKASLKVSTFQGSFHFLKAMHLFSFFILLEPKHVELSFKTVLC